MRPIRINIWALYLVAFVYLASPLVSAAEGLTGARSPDSSSSPLARAVKKSSEVISMTYDLTSKYAKGDKDYFSFAITFTSLQPGGTIQARQTVKGYFTQEVVGARPDGTPIFRVVRNHTTLAMAGPTGAELAPPQVLDFGEGLTYDVCFEDDFPVFPVDTAKFPRDIRGWMMFENIYVSQQFFQVMLTKTHGALDRLNKVGAKVVMPDSHRQGAAGLPPEAVVEINRGESTLEFLGVGAQQGNPAAVLAFDVLYLINIPRLLGVKDGKGREFLRGLTWVSLKDGKILHGRFTGAAFVGSVGPDGKFAPSDVSISGTLERLSPEEYEQQTSH